MKAVQYRTVGAAPEVVALPDPEPGPGQVLIKVTAAGACHSDIGLMSLPAERFRFPLPMTLGHEGAGTVAALGDGVTGFAEGDAVALYAPWGCGSCPQCARGSENYCPHSARLGIHPPGVGAPGAMAEYLLVDDARHLIPLGDLDPVRTVSFTDAALTPYHAIKRSLPRLAPGSTAVVIGAGGLGHVAIQLLRTLSSARVIALDVTEEKLELAREVGAHDVVLSNQDAARRIRELTGGLGAEAVFDFVGARATAETSAQAVAIQGEIAMVGIAGGTLPVGIGAVPYGASAVAPYWGTLPELFEVLELARSGAVDIHVETFGIDEAPLAYERLHAGKINGRAVILPHG
ncbi:NAD(P)-dependent alcohol dehydrogenase [Streptomyces sp. NPDC005498]|uniref:NAD(P)-dependent alcohol dehydrogenase n=1 Tax=Streptomyces sp. NPDC005498 TaxID=3364717 RepID=UPI0036B47E45